MRHSDCAVGDPEVTAVDEKKPWDSTLIIGSVTNPDRPAALRTYFPGAPPVPLVFSLAHNIFLKERVIQQAPAAFFDASAETGETSQLAPPGRGKSAPTSKEWDPSFHVVPSRTNQGVHSDKRVFFESMREETEARQMTKAVIIRTTKAPAAAPAAVAPSPAADDTSLTQALTYSAEDLPGRDPKRASDVEAERVRRRRRQAGIDDTLARYRNSATDPDFAQFRSGFNPVVTGQRHGPSSAGAANGGSELTAEAEQFTASQAQTIKVLAQREADWCPFTGPGADTLSTSSSSAAGVGVAGAAPGAGAGGAGVASSYTNARMRGRFARVGGLAKEDVVPKDMRRRLTDPAAADSLAAAADIALFPALAKAEASADTRRWKRSDGSAAAIPADSAAFAAEDAAEARQRQRMAGWNPGHQALRSGVNSRLHVTQRDLFSTPKPLGGQYTHLGMLGIELTDTKAKRATTGLPMPDGGDNERLAAQSAKMTRHSTVRPGGGAAGAAKAAATTGGGGASYGGSSSSGSVGRTPGDDALSGKGVSASAPGGVGVTAGPQADIIRTRASTAEAFNVMTYLEGPQALNRTIRAAAVESSISAGAGAGAGLRSATGSLEVDPIVYEAAMGGFIPPKRGGEGSISASALNRLALRDLDDSEFAGAAAGRRGMGPAPEVEAAIVVKDGRLVRGGERERIKARLVQAVRRQRKRGWDTHHHLSLGATNQWVHYTKRDLFGKPAASADASALGSLDSMDPDVRRMEYRETVLPGMWDRYTDLLKGEGD